MVANVTLSVTPSPASASISCWMLCTPLTVQHSETVEIAPLPRADGWRGSETVEIAPLPARTGAEGIGDGRNPRCSPAALPGIRLAM